MEGSCRRSWHQHQDLRTEPAGGLFGPDAPGVQVARQAGEANLHWCHRNVANQRRPGRLKLGKRRPKTWPGRQAADPATQSSLILSDGAQAKRHTD